MGDSDVSLFCLLTQLSVWKVTGSEEKQSEPLDWTIKCHM